jgi:hypothetical protein
MKATPEPTRIALNINIIGTFAAPDTAAVSTGRKPASSRPRSIASFMLPNDCWGSAVQLAVIIFYVYIATFMVRTGLVPCLVALFVLKVYGFTVRELGWEGDSTDVLIAPMDNLQDLVVDLVCGAASKATKVVMKALMEGLKDIAEEVKVDVKTE